MLEDECSMLTLLRIQSEQSRRAHRRLCSSWALSTFFATLPTSPLVCEMEGARITYPLSAATNSSSFSVPKAALLAANATTASLFFTNVFNARAAKALNILIIISAFGNLISVMIGQSRLIREVGRQGALPFAEFWSSTRPFGTPTAPYLLKWILTLVMIIAPPAGDAFNFGKPSREAPIL